jgi:hypothetical protein
MPRNHSRATASIDQGKANGWTCRSRACPPCLSPARCAREATLWRGATLILELKQFGLSYKTIAVDAETNSSNISRWAAGDEPRLGLSGLLAVISKMRGTLDETRKRYLTMATPRDTQPVKTLEFSADHGDTDRLRDETDKAVLSNVRLALLGRSSADKEPLPEGCAAVLAQLGDPNFNLWIVHVADAGGSDEPGGSDDLAITQTLDGAIHELRHIIQRLKDRRDRLSRNKRPPDEKPLRLS